MNFGRDRGSSDSIETAIVDALRDADWPLNLVELMRGIGRPAHPLAVQRRLRDLTARGVIEIADAREVRGVTVRRYRVADENASPLATISRPQGVLRDRIIAGTCMAISEGGPRPGVLTILHRAKVARESFYEAFGGLDDCVKDSLRHSLDQLFACIDAGEDWSSWVASHRPQADVIAWGFAIDPDAIEAAIDRAAELLPIEGVAAAGVVGGIYSAVGGRLRAGRPLYSATVRGLQDFAGQYGG